MRVKLPDGKVAEFPDDMPVHEVEKVIGEQYSAITTKPIPSDEEKLEMGMDVVRAAAPIVGDVALTAFAPQLKAAKTAGTLGKLGVKGANALFRSMASGVGSAGGELAGQAITGEGLNLEDAKQEAMLGAGGELGISGAAAVGKPILKTGAGLMSQLTFSGRKMKGIYRDKLIKQTTERAKKFIGDMTPTMSKESAGKMVGETLEKKTDYDVIYQPVNDAIDALAQAPKTAGKISRPTYPHGMDKPATFITEPFKVRGASNEIYMDTALEMLKAEAKKFKNPKQFVDSLNLTTKNKNLMLEFLRNGSLDPKAAKYMLSGFWKKSFNDTPLQETFKSKVKETMLADLSKQQGMGPEEKMIINLRKKADAIYKGSRDWFDNTPAGRRILNKMFSGETYYKANPGPVVDNLMNRYALKDVVNIKREMVKTVQGAKAWAAMEFEWVNSLFEKAITESGMTGERVLKPKMLHDLIMEKEQFFKSVSPQLWPRLAKEAKHYKSMAKEFAAQENKNTFSTAAGLALAASAGGFGNLVAVPIIEGFGAASAWALMSPTAKKALKSNTVKAVKFAGKSAAKAGVHIGGKEVIFDVGD